ncbi:MAG TPA: TM2 domain-containing protein [Candidatus Limadaptatus stercoravium]|nr:TM2 domain-containing protein [Candidatus Limadaptatus stercoravium]
MTNEKIAAIISQVGSQIGETDKLTLRSVLASADDSKYPLIMSVPLKSPTTTLLLSIFLGGLGADRFYIGDTGVGVCKLLFGWLTLGIWPFVDIFVSYKKARQINMRNITAVAA